ncbi:MAG: hypothetical protein ACTSVM_03245, partial [Candidatus Ranarchaeia archaeon]
AIVLIAPSNISIKKTVLARILRFVELGGGLLVLSDGGGDKALKVNLSQLSQYFGVAFNNDHVRQAKGFFGGKTVIRFTSESIDKHEITENLNEVFYSRGCSLRVNKTPALLLRSSRYLIPPNKPLIVASIYGRGRAVFSGSYQMFQDGGQGGIASGDNGKFALQIFQWICAMKLKSAHPNRQPDYTSQASRHLESQSPTRLETTRVPSGKPGPITQKTTRIISNRRTQSSYGIQTKVVTRPSLNPMEEFKSKIEKLNREITGLHHIIETRFSELKSLIQTIGKAFSEKAGVNIAFEELDERSLDKSKVSSYEAKQALTEAIKEKRSLIELLEYVTQRREAGALTERGYDNQRSNLLEKIRKVEERIKSFTNSIQQHNHLVS